MSTETLSSPIHIFRPGTFTSVSGKTVTLTADDLATSARVYDPALHEAPIVVGHPRMDAPAYGWVAGVSFSEDGLYAKPDQVDPAFAELVQAGRFKKRSACFYEPNSPGNPVPGSYYLRHVGFLGAQPPAVKGLRAVEFAEREPGLIEFADPIVTSQISLWRRLRDWFLTNHGQDAADRVVPDWEIESMRDELSGIDAAAAFSEAITKEPSTTTETPPVPPTTTSPASDAARMQQIEAENATLKRQLEAQAAAQTKTATEARHAQSVAFAEGLIEAGQLPPARMDLVVGLLDLAATPDASGASLAFSEGDAQRPLLAGLQELLQGLPTQLAFGEFAAKPRAAGAQPVENPLVADARRRAGQ
ncbi:peptidase [Castellaniella hirudinis]|uniref:peptidase n=1 Tax=Castellaniella hirudinis TaxID=1144617 RepID=UPI0039C48826